MYNIRPDKNSQPEIVCTQVPRGIQQDGALLKIEWKSSSKAQNPRKLSYYLEILILILFQVWKESTCAM